MSRPTVAVVIDVFRAFTTAAVAFDRGAEQILCVKELEAARSIAAATPNSLLLGEDGGLRPAGFEIGNSPAALVDLDLSERATILRTSNGTLGLVESGAEHLLAASAVNATATALFLQATWPDAEVEFVATRPGNEDQAAADFMAAVLANDGQADTERFADELRQLADAAIVKWRSKLGADHPEVVGYEADLALSCVVDSVPIVLVGHRTDQGVVLERGPLA